VETIRILMIAVPKLLGDIVRCAPDDDVMVVGSAAGTQALAAEVERVGANVVLVGDNAPSLPAACCELLTRNPDVKVVVIRANARLATLYELRRRRDVLVQVSPSELLGVIRKVLADHASGWQQE
jgi:DNA-binding NarL/FixJ family response regulator